MKIWWLPQFVTSVRRMFRLKTHLIWKALQKQKRALGRKLVVINGGKSWAVWPFLIRKTLAPFFLSALTRWTNHSNNTHIATCNIDVYFVSYERKKGEFRTFFIEALNSFKAMSDCFDVNNLLPSHLASFITTPFRHKFNTNPSKAHQSSDCFAVNNLFLSLQLHHNINSKQCK